MRRRSYDHKLVNENFHKFLASIARVYPPTDHDDEMRKRKAKESWHRKRHWVSALSALMPSEINQLMAREAEEKFDDYDYIKDLLLKRFKT
ncbi:hypothetical protein TNCV_4498861 [Trichonephila clavipes]|nr:hypothetical protein TNCV_4498861 [Trichonephila clavipes]